jgi:dihydrofolate reductase
LRVQYYTASSLDGFIAGEGDDLDWLTKYRPPDPPPGLERDTTSYDEFYAGVGALVMGSATYEWVLGHADEWPYPDKPSWVLSSRELPAPQGEADVHVVNARVEDLREDFETAVGGKNLWVVGGGPVASQFDDADLLDDVIVTLVPVALRTGKPLFEKPLKHGPMKLVAAVPSPSGMVELRYEVVRG